jgi:hypothetical protein
MTKRQDKQFLAVIAWVLFLGGVIGFALGLFRTFSGGGVPEGFGVMRIATGLWLLFSAVTIYIRNKI